MKDSLPVLVLTSTSTPAPSTSRMYSSNSGWQWLPRILPALMNWCVNSRMGASGTKEKIAPRPSRIVFRLQSGLKDFIFINRWEIADKSSRVTLRQRLASCQNFCAVTRSSPLNRVDSKHVLSRLPAHDQRHFRQP